MRKNIKLLLIAGLCLLTFSGCGPQPAKYVFYFIGDGMGFSHVSAAEAYKSAASGEKVGRENVLFTTFPVLGVANTFSANSNITCSSAAGTALATGHKTNNNMLGVDPEGNNLTSIAYPIHEAGYKVGIMTTVTINHATPASFYANNINRNNYYAIGSQLPESGFEFFAGGDFADPKDRSGDKESLFDMCEGAGYSIYYGMNDYNSKKNNSEKVIIFQDRVTDNIYDYTQFPNAFKRSENQIKLAQTLNAAIEKLNNDKGFFIMTEGGKIDWGAHSNDLANTVYELLDMEEAIAVAYDFYLAHPKETLIVITADHETGGIALGKKGYDLNMGAIDQLGVENDDVNGSNYMSGQVTEDNVSTIANIGWTTPDHTGGAVPVWAIGAGSEAFAGSMDNTDIPKKIIAAMQIDYSFE